MNKTKFTYKSLAITMLLIVVAWFLFDRITKLYFDSGQFVVGQQISPSILGLFHLTLVHNKGAAFGILANSTMLLAVLSFALSAFLFAAPFVYLKKCKAQKLACPISWVHIFAISIVIAGGLGNAIDRVLKGFVVDFICFDFIDFPVFNIADIGVTCGIVILLITMLISFRTQQNGSN